MTRFFHKIRLKLASENQFFKYTRYAIGEIILVVIGILFALQINNWNEGRKQNRADQEFLRNLRMELSLDISRLERKALEFHEFNAIVNTAWELLLAGTPPVDGQRDTLNWALSIFPRLTPFMKNISRNDEFIGQGRLEKIDRELNQEYLNYLDAINASATLYTKLGDALKEIEITQFHARVEFRHRNRELEDVHYDFDEVRSDLFILNGLAKSVLWRGYYINTATDLTEGANGLIARIDTLLEAD